MSFNLDNIEIFHERGLWIPGRIIKLKSTEDDAVDHNMADEFIKNWEILSHFNSNPIKVLMNTPGGSVKDGFAIYDYVKSSPIVATCVVAGECSSMGTIILQAFDQRVSHSNVTFMLHDGSTRVEGNLRDVERATEFTRRERLRCYKLYGEAAGKEAAYFARKLQNDWFLTPEEALNEGLIDEIIQ